jgi:hypothetical protein
MRKILVYKSVLTAAAGMIVSGSMYATELVNGLTEYTVEPGTYLVSVQAEVENCEGGEYNARYDLSNRPIPFTNRKLEQTEVYISLYGIKSSNANYGVPVCNTIAEAKVFFDAKNSTRFFADQEGLFVVGIEKIQLANVPVSSYGAVEFRVPSQSEWVVEMSVPSETCQPQFNLAESLTYEMTGRIGSTVAFASPIVTTDPTAENFGSCAFKSGVIYVNAIGRSPFLLAVSETETLKTRFIKLYAISSKIQIPLVNPL